jgi:hypothetical protein
VSDGTLWRFFLVGLLAMTVIGGAAYSRLLTRWYRGVCATYLGVFFATTFAGMAGWAAFIGVSTFSTLIVSVMALVALGVMWAGLRSLSRQIRASDSGSRQGSGAPEDL